MPTTTPPTTTAAPLQKVKQCYRPVDVVFVLDSSGSIRDNCKATGDRMKCWRDQLTFVSEVVNSFTVGEGPLHARIGVVKFSTGATVEFQLDKYKSNAAVIDAIQKIEYDAGWTSTRLGVEMARTILSESKGMRAKALGVPRVVVVITDGSSSRNQNARSVAKQLQDGGVLMFGVGVQGYNKGELDDLASNPSSTFAKTIDDFAELSASVNSVAGAVCTAVQAEHQSSTTAVQCDRPVDLAIVLDKSGSICANKGSNCQNWKDMTGFAEKLADAFKIGTTELHAKVALVGFGTDATVEFGFNAHQTNGAVKRAIRSSQYHRDFANGQATNTAAALSLVRNTVLKSARSPEIPRIVVVVTDGGYTFKDPKKTADGLRVDGATVFAVGVNKYVPAELKRIANSPASTFVHGVQQFSDMINAVKSVASQVCTVAVRTIAEADDDDGSSGGGTKLLPHQIRCDESVDLFFLLDNSDSIVVPHLGGEENWNIMKEFVGEVVNSFTFGPRIEHARVGIMTFSHVTRRRLSLKDSVKGNSHILDQIKTMSRTNFGWGKQKTYTKKGLEAVRNELMQDSAGMRPAYRNVPRVVVILTDGSASRGQNGASAARAVRDSGATVFSIGVAGYVQSELEAMATSKGHVLTVHQFSELAQAVKDVTARICKGVVSKAVGLTTRDNGQNGCVDLHGRREDLCRWTNDGVPCHGGECRNQLADCQAACRASPTCTGIQFQHSDGNCDFLTGSCNYGKYTATGTWRIQSKECFQPQPQVPPTIPPPKVIYCYPGQTDLKNCKPLPSVDSDANTNPTFASNYGVSVQNSKPTTKHVCDGKFTGWKVGGGLDEWAGVQHAVGRFTNAYFNYDGTHLHILNDWRYNDETPVNPTCYNLFNAWTGNGREKWVLKVYGSGKVYVELNGNEVNQTAADACGAIGFHTSPLETEKPHSIFELSFAASPGRFFVQLHDPGPRFGCDVLESEPATFTGHLNPAGGSTISTVDSVWWSAGTTWCHAGRASKGCRKIPPVMLGSNQNPSWQSGLGRVIRNEWNSGNPSHVTDGKFTGWSAASGGTISNEWRGTVPAIGRFTHAYFNFDGTRLHILNDWYVVVNIVCPWVYVCYTVLIFF